MLARTLPWWLSVAFYTNGCVVTNPQRGKHEEVWLKHIRSQELKRAHYLRNVKRNEEIQYCNWNDPFSPDVGYRWIFIPNETTYGLDKRRCEPWRLSWEGRDYKFGQMYETSNIGRNFGSLKCRVLYKGTKFRPRFLVIHRALLARDISALVYFT
jgi:hypothetical protein